MLDKIPPILARCSAIDSGRGKKERLLTIAEIVRGSTLPRRTVQRIMFKESWAEIRVETASKFLAGCRLDVVHKTDAYNRVLKLGDKNFPHLPTSLRERLYEAMQWK